jgi:hypothetical protein
MKIYSCTNDADREITVDADGILKARTLSDESEFMEGRLLFA